VDADAEDNAPVGASTASSPGRYCGSARVGKRDVPVGEGQLRRVGGMVEAREELSQRGPSEQPLAAAGSGRQGAPAHRLGWGELGGLERTGGVRKPDRQPEVTLSRDLGKGEVRPQWSVSPNGCGLTIRTCGARVPRDRARCTCGSRPAAECCRALW